MTNLILSGVVQSNALACGSAINKIKMSVRSQALHEPVHYFAILGQATAHMVTYAFNIGYVLQACLEGLIERRMVH